MKKISWLAILLVVASVLVSGCSSTNGSGGSDDVIHLKLWGAVPEESGPAQVVENWNKENPKIQVEYKRYVNDEAGNTKLETSLLAGGEVDLFINYRADKLAKRIEAGMVEPLDSYIKKSNFNVEDNFGDKAIIPFNNKTYYIPAIILNDFVTINKSHLEEKGLTIPDSWTWKEYQSYAEKLAVKNGDNKRWGSFVGVMEPKIYEWMDKAVKTDLGANAFYKDGKSNVDNPVFKQYLDIMIEMEQKQKVQPPYAEAKSSKMQGTDLFLRGKTSMNWSGTASLRNIKDVKSYPHDFVTAFAPPPTMNKDSKYKSGGTSYLDFTTINKRSKNKEAAYKFLEWYVTEGNEPMIIGGRVPAWKKADKEKIRKMILGEHPEKLFDVDSFNKVVLNDVMDIVVDNKFDRLAQIQKIVEDEGERALIGEQSSSNAIKNMKEQIDAELQ
jgi:multiple sugar transport system substrate-binding protein